MFTLNKTDKNARAGSLRIGKKILKTPFFMPVGTKATLKAIIGPQLKETQTQCIISNSFVLSMQPGVDLVAKHGGIHQMMNWYGGIFTDSGGFQILIDEFFVRREENGIVFKNPFNGKKELYTPERAIQNQHLIGSDVAMQFDDVPRFGARHDEVAKSIRITHDWAIRCIAEHKRHKKKTNPNQLLFGIAQGNTYEDLRIESAKLLNELDFDGYAIGGVAIGEPVKDLYMAVRTQTAILNPKKPRYVMGLGSPVEILECIEMGADIFDSIYPTQSARRGTLFTKNGPLRITTKQYESDTQPIEKNCSCYTCKHHTRAYVRMLLRTHEYTGFTLASLHNIHFLQQMMQNARKAIAEKKFSQFKKQFIKNYGRGLNPDQTYFHYNIDSQSDSKKKK